MKAITISQPFASLIADGEKFVENRTWQTSHRGLIAIHAGKGTQYMSAAQMRAGGLVTGQIVAVANLVACLEIGFIRRQAEHEEPLSGLNGLSVSDVAQHEHTEGPWCWVLRDVRKISTPIDCAGAQGLWTVPPEIEERLVSTETVEEEIVEADATGVASEESNWSELERQHYEEIQEMEREVREADGHYQHLKCEAAAAKKMFEKLDIALRNKIAAGPDAQRHLPFSDLDEDDSNPEAWRDVAIGDVLELTSKQAETLEAADINTVGQFEDLRAGAGLTSLKGIGQVKAEEWENQMLDWMAANARETEVDDEESDDDE